MIQIVLKNFVCQKRLKLKLFCSYSSSFHKLIYTFTTHMRKTFLDLVPTFIFFTTVKQGDFEQRGDFGQQGVLQL